MISADKRLSSTPHEPLLRKQCQESAQTFIPIDKLSQDDALRLPDANSSNPCNNHMN